MSSHSDLYQQVILDHNKKPKNFNEMQAPSHWAEGHNPLCGDRYKVFLLVEEGKITDISFHGSGCAISKASASMMTEAVKGKSLKELETLHGEFHRLVKGELNPEKEEHRLGKLRIFSGIWEYPARVKCAVLSWHALKSAIERKEAVSTEDRF